LNNEDLPDYESWKHLNIQDPWLLELIKAGALVYIDGRFEIDTIVLLRLKAHH
jgi:hypothetical protein